MAQMPPTASVNENRGLFLRYQADDIILDLSKVQPYTFDLRNSEGLIYRYGQMNFNCKVASNPFSFCEYLPIMEVSTKLRFGAQAGFGVRRSALSTAFAYFETQLNQISSSEYVSAPGYSSTPVTRNVDLIG